MNMGRAKMFDEALDRMIGDLDDVEGKSAMSHSLEDCPDPLGCTEHEAEEGKSLAPEEGSPAAVTIEVHKMGLPSMEGKRAEEGLKPEDVEALKKLLK